MQHNGLRGGLLQVVEARRGAIRIAGNSEGDVGLHTAAAWLCASPPMFGQQFGPAPVCVAILKSLTCHTSHMGGDINGGPPCWQLAHCCWRTRALALCHTLLEPPDTAKPRPSPLPHLIWSTRSLMAPRATLGRISSRLKMEVMSARHTRPPLTWLAGSVNVLMQTRSTGVSWLVYAVLKALRATNTLTHPAAGWG